MKSPNHRDQKDRVADGYDHLECGRKHYELRAWADAYNALSLADQETPLGAEDLELFAMAAYMVAGLPKSAPAIVGCGILFAGDGDRWKHCLIASTNWPPQSDSS